VSPDITRLLRAAREGDSRASEEVLRAMYDELRRLARSRLHRSGEITLLDATSLVHEFYLRLDQAKDVDFADRRYFLGYAARVMRNIVIDLIRERQAARHGGDHDHVTLDTAVAAAIGGGEEQVMRIHEALDELAEVDERLVGVVEMRYFAGFSEAEIASALGVTERTVQRDWHKARMLLATLLQKG
jgi:RNA polymerase sigma factor (TIGR02999 family)